MTEKSTAPALEFTGERFTPECLREIWYEHWHRYAFARELARGKRVLDAACGEGYGSALLAQTAHEVLGLDIADAAIAHARARYASLRHLRFEQGDCTALALPAASVDLVVSFETLEHVAAQEALITGFARTLAPDGVLVISSPDKRTYSDLSGFRNEFHVRELYRDEFLGLLAPHFPYVRLYGQKLLFQSTIWALDEAAEGPVAAATADEGGTQVKSGLRYDPLYFIAVCSREPLSQLPTVALFGDREESVYRHYDHEVRKNMAAGSRIAELEAEVATLRAQLGRLKSP
ncbi:MAG: class I SAM-dependent methyltransferase [Gammaproteobacteria bacterium]|nr:MAG: class I SAM-dependent methyltransferase [Gammaproteobacteria bacterium]